MDLPQAAAAYAHADFAEVNQAFVDKLTELAGDIPKARCLDLGTGPADIPIRLLRARPNWHVTALDASPPMLGFARHAVDQAGMAHAIELVFANAKETGLEENTFDIIFSNSILHHVNEPEGLWIEVRLLARSGALIFFRDLTRPASEAQAQEIVAQYASEESELLQNEFFMSLMAAYTPIEVREQLTAVGLDHLEVSIVTDRHMDIVGRLQ